MKNEELQRTIETCNYYLEIAEDRHNLDAFNYWYIEREKAKRELKKNSQGASNG